MGWHSIVPAPPLDALVETVWDWDMPPMPHRRERILPVPGTTLIINLHEDETRVWHDDGRCERASGSVIGGPYRSSWIIDTAEQVRVMGLTFRPGGAHALTGIDIGELGRRDVDLDALFGAPPHVHHGDPSEAFVFDLPRLAREGKVRPGVDARERVVRASSAPRRRTS